MKSIAQNPPAIDFILLNVLAFWIFFVKLRYIWIVDVDVDVDVEFTSDVL